MTCSPVPAARLIRSKRYIEQDKIHEWAMIPPKEAKLLTYQLHQATFVGVCDLRKPGQQVAPGRLVFLFHLDFNHVRSRVTATTGRRCYGRCVVVDGVMVAGWW